MGTIDRYIEELARDAGVDPVGFTDRARLAAPPSSGDLTKGWA